MTIIYLGTPAPLDQVDESDPKCHLAKVGTVAQNELLKNIDTSKNKLKIITASLTGKKQKAVRLWENGLEAQAVGNLQVSSFGLFLLSLIFTNTFALFTELRRLSRQNSGQPILIITLLTQAPFSIPVLLAKKLYPNVIWCPFLVDTVEAYRHQNLTFRLANKFSVYAANQADACFTYNVPNATDYLPGKPYCELYFTPSAADLVEYQTPIMRTNNKFTITYTGALLDIYNFDAVIEVIKQTGKKYRWVFAGYGENETALAALAADPNYDVDFTGPVLHHQAIEFQKSADLLLCLRLKAGSKVNEYSAKYALSGKWSEYLCSGVPILTSDVEAIPPSFREYLNFVGEDSASITHAIEHIANNPAVFRERAKAGQRFALETFQKTHESAVVNGFIDQLASSL